jgi:ferritin-like metal-binding protein YciE
MASVDSLRTHLVEELTDLRDAEQQLTRALPKMAKAATAPLLEKAFEKHLKETQRHVSRLDDALKALGESPSSKTCEAMKRLLREGEAMMNQTPAGALRDAVLITGAQKVEHYEMASYGTARTYASVLGHAKVAGLLQQTLDEEKAADLTLTTIAERSVNEDAAREWNAQEEQEGMLQQSARALASVGRSMRRAVTSTFSDDSPRKATRKAAGRTKSARKTSSRRASRRTSSTKNSSRRATTRSRGTGKRELIDTGRDKRYVRRDAAGRFGESDKVSRSLAQDRKRRARTRSKKGQGDRGDR